MVSWNFHDLFSRSLIEYIHAILPNVSNRAVSAELNSSDKSPVRATSRPQSVQEYPKVGTRRSSRA